MPRTPEAIDQTPKRMKTQPTETVSNLPGSLNTAMDTPKPSALNVIASDHIFREPEEVLVAGTVTPPEGVRFYNPPRWCDVGNCTGRNSAALPEIVVKRQNPYVPPRERQPAARDRTIARLS